MSDEPWHFASLLSVSEQIRKKEISPVELSRAILKRIEQLDWEICSYITIVGNRALDRARQAEAEIIQGFWRGPLHGVPIALKDLCDTSFAQSTAGMPLHADFRPDRNATVVDRLEAAGAIILGKLAMTEGAFAAHHRNMPTPLNPWSRRHWTGVSSSGSGAATAAGLCYASLASDTGGSIRLPSSACGLTGVKPTWGRVGRHGIFALAESLDHIGPMARSAADAAAVLAAIAGRDENDPTSLDAPVPDYLALLSCGIAGVRLGIDERFVVDGVQPEIAAVVDAAIDALVARGAHVVPIAMPSSERLLDGWIRLCAVEAAVAHRPTYPACSEAYGPELAALLDQGQRVLGLEVAEIGFERARYAGRLAAVFRDVDLIMLPVTDAPTPQLDGLAKAMAEGLPRVARFTAPFNMTGNPTITLQGGFDNDGVPIGFQLVGRHLSEDLLLRAGHAFQQVTDWHCRHPVL